MKTQKRMPLQQLDTTTASARSGAGIAVVQQVVQSKDSRIVLNAGERRQMIEQAAYFRAESRGFVGGCPEQDWYEAEAQINRMLAASPVVM